MKKLLIPVAALAALTTGVGRAADSGNHMLVLQTSEVDVDRHSAGAIEGTLNITLGANGSFLGYFRPVSGGRLIDVHGNVDGKRIALQIGNEPLITGTYIDGKIDGYRSGERDLSEFTAVPARFQRT